MNEYTERQLREMPTNKYKVGHVMCMLDRIIADIRDESLNKDNEAHWADWCRFWKDQLMSAMGTLTDMFTAMQDGVVYGQTTGDKDELRD